MCTDPGKLTIRYVLLPVFRPRRIPARRRCADRETTERSGGNDDDEGSGMDVILMIRGPGTSAHRMQRRGGGVGRGPAASDIAGSIRQDERCRAFGGSIAKSTIRGETTRARTVPSRRPGALAARPEH